MASADGEQSSAKTVGASSKDPGSVEAVSHQLESSAAITDPLGAAGAASSSGAQADAQSSHGLSVPPRKKEKKAKEKAALKPAKAAQQSGQHHLAVIPQETDSAPTV